AGGAFGLISTIGVVALFYLWVSGWIVHRWLDAYRVAGAEKAAGSFVVDSTVRLIVAVAAAGGAYLMIRGRPTVRAGVATAIVVVLAVTTAVRGSTYNDRIAMWRDATVKMPENGRAWVNLGVLLIDKGNAAEGEAALQRAVAEDVTYGSVWARRAAI